MFRQFRNIISSAIDSARETFSERVQEARNDIAALYDNTIGRIPIFKRGGSDEGDTENSNAGTNGSPDTTGIDAIPEIEQAPVEHAPAFIGGHVDDIEEDADSIIADLRGRGLIPDYEPGDFGHLSEGYDGKSYIEADYTIFLVDGTAIDGRIRFYGHEEDIQDAIIAKHGEIDSEDILAVVLA